MAVQTLTVVVGSTTHIDISLIDRTSTNNLLATDIKIYRSIGGTGSFNAFTGFTLSNATAKTASIVPAGLTDADIITIQLNDGTDTSNRITVDFSTSFAAGLGQVNYSVPATPGNYKVNNQQVSGEPVAFDSPVYAASNIPDPTKCSFEFEKAYLVKFVNRVYPLHIALNDGTNTAVTDGNYELVYTETIQP